MAEGYAYWQQNSCSETFILATWETGQGIQQLLQHVDSIIKDVQKSRDEFREMSTKMTYDVETMTRSYVLSHATGEAGQSGMGNDPQAAGVRMMHWNLDCLNKQLQIFEKALPKAELLKYLGERMVDLQDCNKGKDLKSLPKEERDAVSAVAERIDVTWRELWATRVEQEELDALRLKGKDEHGMEDLDAAALEAERAKISPEEAMKEIEDDLERLEEKHKGMRKEATRGLEHY